MNKEFLTVKEAADELHTTERTIRTLIKDGKIKSKKIGTKYIITIQAIREYLES